jgi:CheY-like chemotaxis protein
MSHIAKRTYRLDRKIIRLQDAIENALDMARPSLQSRRHTLSVSIPDEDIYVNADPVRLEQVFANLLDNAGKYTPSGGSIFVSVTRTGNSVVIAVRDTGIGIARDRLVGIFEPFQRSVDHERGSPGLGIGLSISKKIVEMHGGSIVASSGGLDDGSEFRIYLPMSSEKVFSTLDAPQQAPGATPGNGNQKRRIVVVDDNKAAAEGLAKLLRHFGHETELAYDGPEALEVIARFKPDIAVLDIGLPGMSGHELAKEIIKMEKMTPKLIAVTGYGQDEDKMKAKNSGFDYHFTKPVGIADLRSVIDGLGA